MKAGTAVPKNIDDYIARSAPEVQPILQQIRATIRKAAPKATEAIKYQLPTFVFHGNLVHFGAFKHHIGFYATPSGNAEFRRELSAYTNAKGSVQFPLDQPMPLGLVSKMVKFRVQENLARSVAKTKKQPRRAQAQ